MKNSWLGRSQAARLVLAMGGVNLVVAWLIQTRLFAHYPGGGALAAAHFALAYVAHLSLLHGLATLVLLGPVVLWPRRAILLGFVAPAWALLHFVSYLDAGLYALYRLHFDSTVLSFLTTPGLGDSLHLSAGFLARCALVLAGLLVGEILVGWELLRRARRMPTSARFHGRIAWVLATLLALVAIEKAVYLVADVAGWREVLVNVKPLPFYRPWTAKRFAARLGFRVSPRVRLDSNLALRYPRGPVDTAAATNRWNIVWITVEGLRFDMLRPDIMPHLCNLAGRSLTADRHYSTGNATRCAVFGLFYGLQPTYWQAFLAHRRGPVLIRALLDMGYDIRAMGSASFNNPELRQTCFADLSDDQLLHGLQGPVPERDLRLRKEWAGFLETRDAQRPFFCFLFFDSPHSYRFQEREGLRLPNPVPDEETVDYVRLAKDPEARRRAFRRFENAQAFVDSLIGDILRDVEARGLFDNTVILVVGDHGEEFGETGRCGHNNAFNDWQTRTVFVLHYPGVQPGRIRRMTSHVDVTPTLLSLLGVPTPPDVYSQGFHLLSGPPRAYAVAASWSEVALIAETGERIVFPASGYRAPVVDVFDAAYRPVKDRAEVLRRYGPALGDILKAGRAFAQ